MLPTTNIKLGISAAPRRFSAGRGIARSLLLLAGVVCLMLAVLAAAHYGAASAGRTLEPLVTRISTAARASLGAASAEDVLTSRTNQAARQPSTPEIDPSSFDEAVAMYKLKTGRDPPPGYDGWYMRAVEKGCVIHEYDKLYDDVRPFYQLGRDEYRRRLQQAKQGTPRSDRLVIQGGTIVGGQSGGAWRALLEQVAPHVPDVSAVLNGLDEPRVLFHPLSFGPIAKEERNGWVQPMRGQHRGYLGATCDLHNPAKMPPEPLAAVHGFLTEPDTSMYTRELLPILSQCKVAGCFSDILIPSAYFYNEYEPALLQGPPWEQRKPLCYWRGSSTGGRATGGNWRGFHRPRFLWLARNRTDLFDAGLIATIQCDFRDCADMTREFGIVQRMDFANVVNYKYVLDLDGNSFSSRFVRLSRAGALIFKATIFDEYFQGWYVPYKHYIPVSMDLSDLAAKVQWAQQHDDLARRIAEAGSRFSMTYLTRGQMECYTELLLLELSRLQGGPL